VPTAAAIDSPDRPRRRHRPDHQHGYDAGRRSEPQAHIAVDTGGLLLAVVVTTASLQDRDGVFRITAALREAFSTITSVWAASRRPSSARICAAAVWSGSSNGCSRRASTGAVQESRSKPSWAIHWKAQPAMIG